MTLILGKQEAGGLVIAEYDSLYVPEPKPRLGAVAALVALGALARRRLPAVSHIPRGSRTTSWRGGARARLKGARGRELARAVELRFLSLGPGAVRASGTQGGCSEGGVVPSAVEERRTYLKTVVAGCRCIRAGRR